MKKIYFPINKIKSKEIYYFIDKFNNNKLNSMFILVTKKINKLKKRINNYFNNNILHIDIYIIQYKNIKKNLYKVDIKQNIIQLKKKYVYKLKVVNKYILLKKI